MKPASDDAKPGVEVTQPSRARNRVRTKVSRIASPPVERRRPGVEPSAASRLAQRVATVSDCWVETSTCAPRPLRRRPWSAIRAATAPSLAACSAACGTDTRTGARSASPVR